MKYLPFILLLIMCDQTAAQPRSFPKMHACYSHPKLDSLVASHHTIAFVGEYTYLTNRVDQKSFAERDSIIQGSSLLACHLAEALLREEMKIRVIVQHPDSTYTILERAGIKPSETSLYDRRVLSELLGVDAVVTMRFLVFKKLYPAEAHVINIVSIASTFAMAAQGFYTAIFPIAAGTDVIYESTTIHTHTGELIYLENSINTTFPKMHPGGLKNKNKMRDFPYFIN